MDLGIGFSGCIVSMENANKIVGYGEPSLKTTWWLTTRDNDMHSYGEQNDMAMFWRWDMPTCPNKRLLSFFCNPIPRSYQTPPWHGPNGNVEIPGPKNTIGVSLV